VETGQIKRFLTGPKGCEITGITRTPDGSTLFINIQHPGENPLERSDPANPTTISAWPANQFADVTGGRPRSATIAISRKDGKVVGV
jgi:secreted PhoX family phosphatase